MSKAKFKKAAQVPHPHAGSMALYAEDARETSEPWKRWELRYTGGTNGVDGDWGPAVNNPDWDPLFQYRRLRERAMVNGVEVTLGEKNEPEEETEFHYPVTNCPRHSSDTDTEFWDPDDKLHRFLFDNRMVYLTQEEASARAKAMVKFA